uniref:Solute carrier family 35 member F6 n=1 Tax=Schistocephalus solidus TaxID=70667 RepID=A0A0X3NF88_SCHSO
MCDVVGSTLQGIGLVYIDASVWQMLRGSIIVFVGILSKIFLRRRLWCFHWTGMMVTVFGLCLVGVASVFKPTTESLITSPAKAALGLLLVLLGSLATASQMIVEEIFLKKHGFHAMHVVGMEGFFGMFVMGFIILPSIHHIPGHDLNGSFENQLDALYQTFQDPVLLSTTILLVLSIAFFNYFGLAVTGSLSAVHRTLLDALRAVFVWCSSLFLFYAVSHRFGEPFDPAWGLIEIDGFCMLVMGTLIFNKILRLDWIPCCGDSYNSAPAIPEESVEVPGDSVTDDSSEKKPLLAGDAAAHSGTFGSVNDQVTSIQA